MRWLSAVVAVAMLACSGTGREGLSDNGSSSRSGQVGKDAVQGDGDVTVPVDVGDPPCLDCDIVMVDVPMPEDANPLPSGCCAVDDDCPPSTAGATVFCVGQATSPNGLGECMGPPPGEDWCYADGHCAPGYECHGATACGCNVDCDPPYLGPGVCVPEAPGCTPVKEQWVQEICNAASVVIWDGTQCVATCPGCCGCEPFCEFTFQTMEACQTSCIAPDECPLYVGALAEAPFVYRQTPVGCISQDAMAGPCKIDDDCPGIYPDGTPAGDYCVLGNCAFCWNDTQCSDGEVCRAGRCVEQMMGCPPVDCAGPGCQLISPSELPCPVCICNSTYGLPCQADEDCMVISSHPYGACVNGRCADCRNDDQCPSLWGPGGTTCAQPGICYETTPPVFALYGLWMIGWPGGLNHFSYFRFEPDGTLRRGRYEPPVAWSDDIPPVPCLDPADQSFPLLGTWEPEVTESGFLVVRIRLNVSCDSGEGYGGRWLFTLSDSWAVGQVTDIDSDWQWEAQRVSMSACEADMSMCDNPELYLPW